MEKRLVKIAKELNVGTTTIVEHLINSGFEIENKPTAKITDEMYAVLLKEFQKSIAIKEQADQLIIGTRTAPGKKEKETSPFSSKTDKESPLTKRIHEEAKSRVSTPGEKEQPHEAEKHEEEAKPRLKILGKIDLGSRFKPGGKKEEEPAKAEAPKEEPKAKEKIAEEKKPEEAVEEQAQPAAEIPKEAKEPKEEAEPAEVEKKSPPVVAEEPKVEEVEEAEEPVAKEKASKDTPKAEEFMRAETPELRGLKILGKIDADKLKRPKKKKKKEKEKEKEKPKPLAEADSRKKEKPAETEEQKQARSKRRKRKRKRVPAAGEGVAAKTDRGRGRTEEEVKEVSQKEIDEKIRATMARLSGGGKKKRQKMRRETRERHRERQELIELEKQSEKLQLTEFVSVQELANLMDVDVSDVITTCLNLGVIVSINQRLDAEIIELVAEEFGHEVEFINVEDHVEEEEEIYDEPEDLLPRAPIVTVMGHVDHGKTSLLDYIRKANVAGGEAGGITQHIGAYEVLVGEEQKKITFLDTPGHEAFTAMRARGAKVTDIAVIIIAADDNIMPQTREAISHAQAAGVPIVFAVNKIDKPGAQPEKIKQELASMNFLVESWGGKYQSQDISAKTGDGIDELLEKILLEAEILELTANPEREAFGTVLEASLDKGRGYVAKTLVQTGTLKIGDPIVSGEHSGKVKAMFNERGKRIKEAGPSTPVLVLGLSGAPQAGERFKVVDSEQEARQIASKRAQIVREQTARATKRISLDEIGRRLALGTFKELNLIVKGDVDGSVEALSDSLIKLTQETVQVGVIHKAVGQITESDVLLASASDAIIIGFQVRPSASARKLAEREGVQIKLYSIIYEAIEQVKAAIEGMLEPTKEERIIATVEVREVYKISKVGAVAGCYVQEGKIARNTNIRLIRNGIVVYPTKEGQAAEIASLKRFKDDVKEVRSGMECGISIKNFNDIKVGDIIEGYEIVEIKQKLVE
jgi:translation initiation factor IF-2